MITNYTPIPWPDGYIKWWYETSPSLYDDVYMDLTFVEVFDRLGLDAPVDSIAMAFATAEYRLWHANQAARYNILNGIMPPESGHWLNNPHADDLDFQIEADFAGLMNPGMPNSASEISDKVGHIMCYGDGWYGGVYVGAMYALAFVSDDMEFVVTEALKTIPKESKFYQCINDVIGWHKQYPDDWQQTWFEATRKWNEDVGCPSGVFGSFNIDAVINSAYIVIGLLYGEKDFFKTMDIANFSDDTGGVDLANAGDGGQCIRDDLKLLLNSFVQYLDLLFQGTHRSDRNGHSLIHGIVYSDWQAVRISSCNTDSFCLGCGVCKVSAGFINKCSQFL